jgi:hypothetical protein
MNRTFRNALLAFVLSVAISLIVAVIYIFYPLITVMFSARQGAGIVGISSTENVFCVLLIIEPILFIIIFVLLQWKNRKS